MTPEVALAALAALDEAAALDQEQIAPTRSHLRRALAMQHNVRVLDGLYVALAAERDCSLVTTDAPLARANPSCDVILVRGAT